MILSRITYLGCVALLLTACTSAPVITDCRKNDDSEACLPPDAVVDTDINKLYRSRAWISPMKLEVDVVKLGKEAEIPINSAYGKIIGPSMDDSIASLAAKLWMIENAEHTIDLAYYIFTRDLAGYAILGALCDAVKRGVDVRIVVDSIGSFHPTHSELKGLETCADEAGFMRNEAGELTTRRARVQTVVFNAISKAFVRFNRRSHDKIIIKDGHFPDKAYIMTGGRNISVAYYGIKDDGTLDPNAYKDLEILLKPGPSVADEEYGVGSVSEIYYSLLFLYKGNKRVWPADDDELYDVYLKQQQVALDRLVQLKSIPEFARVYPTMDEYMTTGFHKAKVRLAHELANLSSGDVVAGFKENLENNPNSIVRLMEEIDEEAGHKVKTIRLVSPYFFIPKYFDEEGNEIYDGVAEMMRWLDQNPDRTVELITNSVMTSDNFMAQAIIDMDTVPRMLLTPELKKVWQKDLDSGEFNPEVIESEEWKRLINNPRIKIYQSGRLDDVMFEGGTKHYGKLHAKFILSEEVGFVGTTNLDYRSRLYNNEMGFFFQGEELQHELNAMFDKLKKGAYLWGSPEWLEMRRQLMALETSKGKRARKQHSIFTRLRRWGLEWQI